MSQIDQRRLVVLAVRLGALLGNEQLKLVTAESCTGGWVAQCLTAIAGSSAWFDRGFVTYSNEAKQEMLGVPPDMLAEHGAVSQPVAVAMAEGALRNSRADWAVAITGIAGPTGGSPQKPVGTVCFAWGCRDGRIVTSTKHFPGSREDVRAQSVEHALRGLIERMDQSTGEVAA